MYLTSEVLLITVQLDVAEERSTEKFVTGRPFPPGIVQLSETDVAPIIPPKLKGAFGLTEVIELVVDGVDVDCAATLRAKEKVSSPTIFPTVT